MMEDKKDYFYKSLGENIRIARENAGLKQGPFAVLIGLSRTSVVNIEKGRQHAPLCLVWLIAEVLEISYNDFIPAPKPKGKQLQASISAQLDARIDESIRKKAKSNKAATNKVKSFIDDITFA